MLILFFWGVGEVREVIGDLASFLAFFDGRSERICSCHFSWLLKQIRLICLWLTFLSKIYFYQTTKLRYCPSSPSRRSRRMENGYLFFSCHSYSSPSLYLALSSYSSEVVSSKSGSSRPLQGAPRVGLGIIVSS